LEIIDLLRMAERKLIGVVLLNAYFSDKPLKDQRKGGEGGGWGEKRSVVLFLPLNIVGGREGFSTDRTKRTESRS